MSTEKLDRLNNDLREAKRAYDNAERVLVVARMALHKAEAERDAEWRRYLEFRADQQIKPTELT